MACIIEDSFKQHDPEWYEAKLGKFSASGAEKILSPTGLISKQSVAYAKEKAYEIITGKRIEKPTTWQMKKGNEDEPWGREAYALEYGVSVREVALIYYDEKREWLVSPDGLIDDDGMLELKWCEGVTQITRLEEGWDKKEHYPQLQCNLLCSGRKWIDRVSYHPGLNLVVDRYYRDEEYIGKLYQEIYKFNKQVKAITERLMNR